MQTQQPHGNRQTPNNPNNFIFIFDYDHTIIRDNSDTFIPLHLKGHTAKEMLNKYDGNPPWNPFMDAIVVAMQHDGNTISDIREAAKSLPFFPEMLTCLGECAVRGPLHIVSDANTVYISSFLQHHSLDTIVTGLHTNPTTIDQNGILRVMSYHHSTCSWCQANMCKGDIIGHILHGMTDEMRVVYVGDGRGDFHPASLLTSRDFVFVRYDVDEPRAMGLHKLIEKHPEMIKACIVRWKDGHELLTKLRAHNVL